MGHGRDPRGLRKDGSAFPVEIALNPITTEDGPMVLATVIDISERKQAEENLKRYARELERSNTELDDFAYVASHDLKEPLRGINNYAAFLAEDYAEKLDEEGREKIDTLQRLCRRLETLIDSLLTYSRLDAIVDDVLDSVHVSVEELGVEVRRPQPLPTIECDSVRVAEVFRNLVTNALKYNDKPDKWIEIGCELATSEAIAGSAPGGDGFRPGDTVFYVRDNGIGIREKHTESIFRIFKRLHGRDKFGGGTGAGLTIVKKIVERHGGHISVASTQGKGTTFHFTLG